LLGTAEPHLQRAIRRYVAPGDTVYDIGANIGYVSLSLARQVGPQGRVFAFEPVPKNIQRCRTNIEINKLTNIKLLEFAASNVNGEAVIRMTDNLSMASLVWHQEDPSATQLVVKTVALDDLVEGGELPPPTFVKIDVEGGEASVLEGMLRMITTAKPVLFIECSDTGREYTWHTLRQLGYQCQSAIQQTPVTTFEQYRHADFLWIPAR
jgi:FkbM family methyltransferase